jgi:glycosyltransferase involved in cell wall biosynthesis
MRKKIKLLIVCNVDWFLISHRLGIIKKAVSEGYEVIVAAEDTGRTHEIVDLGAQFINLTFTRSGTNPIKELQVISRFFKLYKSINPDIVHHVTMKPVVYGSFVARRLKIKGVVNAIAGLGTSFTSKNQGLFLTIVGKVMRYGFNRKNLTVIFQNDNDFQDLRTSGILNEQKNSVRFTKGSGVDLNKFDYTEPVSKEKLNILFPTRMLWDKGVRELKEASIILKEEFHDRITFLLAGLADDGNKGGVSKEYLLNWDDGKYVKWIGYQKDMVEVYKQADIVVLPSYYREGIPKALIEACASGRPIVTTNSIGCKECVDEGVNGFKVQPRSGEDLAKALKQLIMDGELRYKMGLASRNKALNEFSEETVIETHMDIYSKLVN